MPKGINPPSLNMLYFTGPQLALAIKTGIITGILSLTVSTCFHKDVNTDYSHDSVAEQSFSFCFFYNIRKELP